MPHLTLRAVTKFRLHRPRGLFRLRIGSAAIATLLALLPSAARAQTSPQPPAPAPVATPTPSPARTPDVALAVVYDTSGSMGGTIPSLGGKPEAKHLIAKRALGAVATRLEKFTAPSAPKSSDSTPSAPASARALDLGLYVFKLDEAATALPLAPFDATQLRTWLDSHGRPRDSTPLGLTMQLAGQALLASPAPHKHLLVLTDGANSSGIEPENVLDLLRADSEKNQTPLFVHVIALGIKPSIFKALKERGATLIGASDEKQLQTQLDFILENQILLEAP